MTSFLFWNVMKRDLRDLIARAVVEHDIDILMLAESGVADAEMIATLNAATKQNYITPLEATDEDKVRIFTRIKRSNWRPISRGGPRMVVWRVKVGRPPGVLLAVAHFPSKNNESSSGQAMLATRFATDIVLAEQTAKHERTILVGDLNMNPFEDGVTGVMALNAVMTKPLAGRGERVYLGQSYRHFYNPMWGHFGDRTFGPSGTYYHRSATNTEVYWHMLDQVLLRPELMDQLQELRILDSIAGESLLTSLVGLPNYSAYSDHLPLQFRLNLN
jgi:exonuclease III